MTRTWAVDTAFARVQLRFKRFPSLHTLLLCIAARAFALPVEVDSSHWPNAALHLPFTHCIHRQVVAAHRPILDFVQAVAACCCLSFPLSCAAVLHGAAGGVATHSFPSSFCPKPPLRMCRQPTELRSLHPVYHLPPPPTSCLASHVSSPLCACVQALAAFCRLNSSAPVTCYRQPRRVRQAATALVPPPSTPAPVRSAQNIFAPATARRVCDCIINGRRARMRGGSGRRGAEWAGAGAGECGK